VKPWVKFSIIRVGLFAVVVVITYPLFRASGVVTPRTAGFISAIIGALISLAVSYLAFGRLRNQVATEIVELRKKPAGGSGADEQAEDAIEEDAEL